MELDAATIVQLGSTVAIAIGAVFAYRWSSAKLDAEATEKITGAAKVAVDLVQGTVEGLQLRIAELESNVTRLEATEQALRLRVLALEAEVRRLGGDPSQVNGRR